MKKYFKVMYYLVCGSLLIFSNGAASQERTQRGPSQGWFYGIGVNSSTTLYQGYNRRTMPIPMVGYFGDRFRLFGPFTSYTILKNKGFEIDLKISPRFGGYNENDSSVFEGMDKRKFSFDGGIGASYSVNNWRLSGEAKHDILGRSNGFELNADLAYEWRIGPFSLSPKLGINYLDDNTVDYYYGVKANEATGLRPFYIGQSSLNYKFGLSAGFPLLGGMVRINIDNTRYNKAIWESPLVDSKNTTGLMISFTRFF